MRWLFQSPCWLRLCEDLSSAVLWSSLTAVTSFSISAKPAPSEDFTAAGNLKADSCTLSKIGSRSKAETNSQAWTLLNTDIIFKALQRLPVDCKQFQCRQRVSKHLWYTGCRPSSHGLVPILLGRIHMIRPLFYYLLDLLLTWPDQDQSN